MWFLFFFKRKTAYELRISDWSSDVCSSDLTPLLARIGHDIARRLEIGNADADAEADKAPAKRTIIVGFGRVGRIVAELLRTHQRPYIAVDADIDAVAAARRDGFIVR